MSDRRDGETFARKVSKASRAKGALGGNAERGEQAREPIIKTRVMKKQPDETEGFRRIDSTNSRRIECELLDNSDMSISQCRESSLGGRVPYESVGQPIARRICEIEVRLHRMMRGQKLQRVEGITAPPGGRPHTCV